MRRRWRRLIANPRSNLYLSFACAGIAGVLAFLAVVARAQLQRGTSSHSATFLLSGIALLWSVAAAAFDARYADLMSEFLPAQVRRGAFLRLLVGVVLTLGGCVVASSVSGSRAGGVPAGAGNAVLYIGIALALGGIARFMFGEGAEYAATKVQERLDDDY